jgi:tRNA threonylcarbamoyl adenosine modification protein (Sua5/YciO/YrdC/YwlC family)
LCENVDINDGLVSTRHARGQTPAVAVTDEAVAGIRAGKAVVLPTDTVYGLCVDAYREEPVRRLQRLKQRPEAMPIALLAADLDAVLEAIPELRGRAAVVARALLPGPYTLVLSNPARRFRWLTGTTPEAIGIRIPDLPEPARAVLDRVGVVAATSANLHGDMDPARVEEIPDQIRAAVDAVVDVGPLPGTPSTVVDLTGREPQVLREGAVAADEARARIARVAAE